MRILQYGTGLIIAIIGFTIWPDLTSTQLLNHAIKTRPTVYYTLDKRYTMIGIVAAKAMGKRTLCRYRHHKIVILFDAIMCSNAHYNDLQSIGSNF